jgi:hypothetical protein
MTTNISKNCENNKWPPTEDQIKSRALSALDQSQNKDVKVLIYWENNPNLMIFDPIHRAQTEYIRRRFKSNDGRSVLVEIGKID